MKKKLTLEQIRKNPDIRFWQHYNFLQKQERQLEISENEQMIRGYAIMWDSPTEIWRGYYEQFSKGAFSEALASDDLDVAALLDHRGLAIARTPDTMQLKEDDDGLYYEVVVSEDDPDGKSLTSKISRGTIKNVSIGFTMYRGGEYRIVEQEDGTVLEIIEKVANLWEVSFVTFPAYENTTAEIVSRNMQHRFKNLHDELVRERQKQKDDETTPEPSLPVFDIERAERFVSLY